MAESLEGDRCPKCNGKGTVIANFGGLHVEVDCDECSGTGVVNSSNACKECHGKGTVNVDVGGFYVEARCDRCNGTGFEPK